MPGTTQLETAAFVTEASVMDPATGEVVELEVWKHPNGGMFGIDSSYLTQVTTGIQDPFDEDGGGRLALPLPPRGR